MEHLPTGEPGGVLRNSGILGALQSKRVVWMSWDHENLKSGVLFNRVYIYAVTPQAGVLAASCWLCLWHGTTLTWLIQNLDMVALKNSGQAKHDSEILAPRYHATYFSHIITKIEICCCGVYNITARQGSWHSCCFEALRHAVFW